MMWPPRIDADSLLRSSKERLRLSRALVTDAHSSVCRSRALIDRSRELLGYRGNSHLPSGEGMSALGAASQPLSALLNALTGTGPAVVAAGIADIAATQHAGEEHALRQHGEDLMELVSGRTIEGEVVSMDCRHFVDCNLVNCTLEYGGQPVLIEGTEFNGCSFRFLGEAALTTRFLECFGLLPRSLAEDSNASVASPKKLVN